MLVLLITGGAYLLVSQLNRASGRIDAEKKTAAALAQAKEALIGWAVSNLTTPGMLPYPDRRNDGDYDGRSDCPAAGIPTSAGLLLGKIPQIGPEAPCLVPWTALNLDVVDGAGEVLWYAVSRNMVSALGVAPVINPDIMNTPPFPWLVVRDQTGAIINNRVAFVLIAPGSPLPGQNRSGAAPTPIQFLEGIGAVTNADSDGNYDGGVPACPSGMCEDFVMSEPWPSATAPTFNDRLLYVTIDELMPLIEKRVAREARQALIAYYNASDVVTPANRYFPYPANFGYQGGQSCVNTNRSGFLPMSICTCTCSGTNCTCNCTGRGTILAPSGSGPFTSTTGGCVGTSSNMCNCNSIGTCTTSASGSVPLCAHPLLPNFPAWFTTNDWGRFIYYAVGNDCILSSRGCDSLNPLDFLSVGPTTNINAVVISTGRVLTGTACSTGPHPIQTRPSTNTCDYLDTVENTDGPPNFTPVGQLLTNIFNDQAVIVSP